VDYKELTAPCGLDCFNCLTYLASQDEEVIGSVAEELGISVEDAKCTGCRNMGGLIPSQGMTKPCPIFVCAEEKGHTFCFECADFMCAKLDPNSAQSGQAACNVRTINLTLIKRMGVDKWAREKMRRVRKIQEEMITKYNL
jgi:hypothetical protein